MNEFDKRTGRSYTSTIQTRKMTNKFQFSQLQQLRLLDKFHDDNDDDVDIIYSDYSGNNCNYNCTHTCIDNSSIHDDDCTHTPLSSQETSLLLKSNHERSRVVCAAELQLTTINTAVTSDSSDCSVYCDSLNNNETSFTTALGIMRSTKKDLEETLSSSYQSGSSGYERRRSKKSNKDENGYHNKQKTTTNVPYSLDDYDFANCNLHIEEGEYRYPSSQTQLEDETQIGNASIPSIKVESLKDQEGVQKEIEVLVSPSLSIPTSTLGIDSDIVTSHLVSSAMIQSSLPINSNLDKTSPLSEICLDDNCSSYNHLLHRHRHRHVHDKKTHHDTQVLSQEGETNHNWLDTIKSLFFHNSVASGRDSISYKNNNMLTLSSPTKATAAKTTVTTITTTPTTKPMLSNLCPTMYCCTRHQADNSPQTPEYEKICKEELQRRQQNELNLDKNKNYNDICHHWDVNVPLSAQKERPKLYSHDYNQSQMKTVKKRNTKDHSTTSFIKNQSQIKTAKKKNITSKRTSTKSNKVFQTQQECYFRGFDGKRSHYTYVSPKKNENGYPIIDLDDMDDDLLIGKNIDFMAVAASTTSPTTTSPEIVLENETSVLHIISPKTKSPTRTVHDDLKGYYEMMNIKRSIDTSTSSSLSMISEEVRMSNQIIFVILHKL